MIERNCPQLSIREQATLLGVSRSRLNLKGRISKGDRAIMRDLDERQSRRPVSGPRKLAVELRKGGGKIDRRRMRRLLEIMGIAAAAPKPGTSVPDKSRRNV